MEESQECDVVFDMGWDLSPKSPVRRIECVSTPVDPVKIIDSLIQQEDEKFWEELGSSASALPPPTPAKKKKVRRRKKGGVKVRAERERRKRQLSETTDDCCEPEDVFVKAKRKRYAPILPDWPSSDEEFHTPAPAKKRIIISSGSSSSLPSLDACISAPPSTPVPAAALESPSPSPRVRSPTPPSTPPNQLSCVTSPPPVQQPRQRAFSTPKVSGRFVKCVPCNVSVTRTNWSKHKKQGNISWHLQNGATV